MKACAVSSLHPPPHATARFKQLLPTSLARNAIKYKCFQRARCLCAEVPRQRASLLRTPRLGCRESGPEPPKHLTSNAQKRNWALLCMAASFPCGGKDQPRQRAADDSVLSLLQGRCLPSNSGAAVVWLPRPKASPLPSVSQGRDNAPVF